MKFKYLDMVKIIAPESFYYGFIGNVTKYFPNRITFFGRKTIPVKYEVLLKGVNKFITVNENDLESTK